MVIAILAVIAALVFSYRARTGEMSVERSDYVPLDLGPVSATDVALLRPPSALWGYSVEATDEAMAQIAESIRERDVRIVALEQLVTDLGRSQQPMAPLASPYTGARHRRAPADGAADTGTLPWAGTEPAWQAPEQSWDGRPAPEQSWEGQEPSWQEPEQSWQDHEVAWQQEQGQHEQSQQDESQQGQEQPRQQEQEQPWQSAEPPWQSPEQSWQDPEPHPAGDNDQLPPPERSHD
jgi:hypothetical protein